MTRMSISGFIVTTHLLAAVLASAGVPPVSNAGPNQTASVGAPVTLGGCATAGKVDKYDWPLDCASQQAAYPP